MKTLFKILEYFFITTLGLFLLITVLGHRSKNSGTKGISPADLKQLEQIIAVNTLLLALTILATRQSNK